MLSLILNHGNAPEMKCCGSSHSREGRGMEKSKNKRMFVKYCVRVYIAIKCLDYTHGNHF